MKESERNLRLAALKWADAKRALEAYDAPKSGHGFEALVKAWVDASTALSAASEAYVKRALELGLPEGADPDILLIGSAMTATKDNLLIHFVADRGGSATVSLTDLDKAKGYVLTALNLDEDQLALAVEAKQ